MYNKCYWFIIGVFKLHAKDPSLSLSHNISTLVLLLPNHYLNPCANPEPQLKVKERLTSSPETVCIWQVRISFNKTKIFQLPINTPFMLINIALNCTSSMYVLLNLEDQTSEWSSEV